MNEHFKINYGTAIAENVPGEVYTISQVDLVTGKTVRIYLSGDELGALVNWVNGIKKNKN